MNALLDQILNFYGASTAGSYVRKLERVIRFIKFTEQQEETSQVVVPTLNDNEPIAYRTRSRYQVPSQQQELTFNTRKRTGTPTARKEPAKKRKMTTTNQPIALRTRSHVVQQQPPTTKEQQPIAYRTRNQQPIASRTRSKVY